MKSASCSSDEEDEEEEDPDGLHRVYNEPLLPQYRCVAEPGGRAAASADVELTLNFTRQSNHMTLDTLARRGNAVVATNAHGGVVYGGGANSARLRGALLEDPQLKFLDDPHFEPYGGWLGYGSGTAYAQTAS